MRNKHDIFDVWDETSAYLFGFWLADGSLLHRKIKNNYYKIWKLTNTDTQIIKKISAILKHKYTTATDKKRPTTQPVHQIRIYSDKLFDFCHTMVSCGNKTNASYPLPCIPDDMFHHFVRGFFDGDGSVFIKSYKTRHKKIIYALTTSFAGSKDSTILELLRDYLSLKIGTGNKKVTIYKHNKLAKNGKATHTKTLSYNQYDSYLLCEWMYSGTTIHMKRKKEIYDGFDKQKLIDSKKYFSNKV